MSLGIEAAKQHWFNPSRYTHDRSLTTQDNIVYEHKQAHPYYKWMLDQYNTQSYLQKYNKQTHPPELPQALDINKLLVSAKGIPNQETRPALLLAIKTLIATIANKTQVTPLSEHMQLNVDTGHMSEEHMEQIESMIADSTGEATIRLICQASTMARIIYRQKMWGITQFCMAHESSYQWQLDIQEIFEHHIPHATIDKLANYTRCLVDRIPPPLHTPNSSWMTHNHSFTMWPTPILYDNTLLHITRRNTKGRHLERANLFRALLDYHAAVVSGVHPVEIKHIHIYKASHDHIYAFDIPSMMHQLSDKNKSGNRTTQQIQDSFTLLCEDMHTRHVELSPPPEQKTPVTQTKQDMNYYHKIIPYLNKGYSIHVWDTEYRITWQHTFTDPRVEPYEFNVLIASMDKKDIDTSKLCETIHLTIKQHHETVSSSEWREQVVSDIQQQQLWKEEQLRQQKEIMEAYEKAKREEEEANRREEAKRRQVAIYKANWLNNKTSRSVPGFTVTNNKGGLTLPKYTDDYGTTHEESVWW